MIYPSITTIGFANSKWRDKVKEVAEKGLEEICLFPTCLEKKERQELYDLLKKTKVKRIPLVHLRDGMSKEELEYFLKNYNTQAFNIHGSVYELPRANISGYEDIVFIENSYYSLTKKDLEGFAGVCLDFSHLENKRKTEPEKYKEDIKILEKYGCGCNHINAIKKELITDMMPSRYDSHAFEDLSEFDYLKKYPKKYFSSILALELENSIADQLKAKEYITNLLKGKI